MAFNGKQEHFFSPFPFPQLLTANAMFSTRSHYVSYGTVSRPNAASISGLLVNKPADYDRK